MTVEFVVKYGLNEIELPINGGVTLRFVPKFGQNVVAIPTTDKVLFFVVKYGKNVLEIPEDVEPTAKNHTNLFKSKVTIYNDIPFDGVTPRHFDRRVIDLCNIQKGILQTSDGTVEKLVNAQTVITKDIEHYKPFFEYVALPVDEKDKYFTANVNDFVVLGEVDDIPTTSREWQDLQEKYKNNGFSVTSVNEYLYGTTVDNVQIIHA